MKTLNEKLYEYLMNACKPINIGDILNDKEFSKVPQRLIGSKLLAIHSEGLANYYIKDGKMYFTTDLSQGRGMIGSQSFISSLSGVASNPLLGLFSAALRAFPEVGDAKTDAELNAIQFTSKCRCDTYEIAFPSNHVGKIAPDNDETLAHDFVADYSGGPISKMTISTDLSEQEWSREARAEVTRMGLTSYIDNLAGFLRAPGEYVTDTAYAFYLPIAPSCNIQIVRPDGRQDLRIDWNFGDRLPSKSVAINFFERWIDTYRYIGGKQYAKPWTLDFDKVLKKNPSAQMQKQILAEIETAIDKAASDQAVFIFCATSEEVVKKPTKFLHNSRCILQRAAKLADEFIDCMTRVITFYLSENVSDDFLFELCVCGEKAMNMAVTLAAEVNVGTDEATVRVQEFPSRAYDYADFVIKQVLSIKSIDSQAKEDAKEIHRCFKELYDAVNKESDENFDFDIKGKTLVAYLGTAEDVTVPENVSTIGFGAFKNVTQLKTVTIGAGVTEIGGFAFCGCSNLKTVKILGDPTLQGILGDGSFTVQAYKGTEVEKYCNQCKLKFEALPEDDTPLIKIDSSGAYTYEGFMFPKVFGCKATSEFNSLEKKEWEENKGPSNMKFAIISTDKPISQSAGARFSLSAGDSVKTSGDGIGQVMHLEQMASTKTFHDKYSTVKADGGKVVVRYDVLSTRENDGVRCTTYLFAVASDDAIMPMFMTFNGNHSPKQQQAALESYAREIVTTKSYYEKVKKEQERAKQKRIAEEKEEAEKKAKQQAKTNKPIVKQYLAQIDEYKKSVEAVVKKRKSEQQGIIQKEIKQLEDEKQSHKEALAKLGLFAFSERKAEKAEIARIEAKIAEISTPEHAAEQAKIIENCGNSAFEAYKEDVEDFLAKKYNMPYKQKEVRKKIDIKAVNKKECDAMAADGKSLLTDYKKSNNLLELALLKVMYEDEKGLYKIYLITDLEDMLKDAGEIDVESISYQKLASILNSLVKDGFIIKQEIRRRLYYSLAVGEQKEKVAMRLKGLPMLEKQPKYVENEYYASLKCPSLPSKKALSKKIEKKLKSEAKSREEKRIREEEARKEAKRQLAQGRKEIFKFLFVAVLIITAIIMWFVIAVELDSEFMFVSGAFVLCLIIALIIEYLRFALKP